VTWAVRVNDHAVRDVKSRVIGLVMEWRVPERSAVPLLTKSWVDERLRKNLRMTKFTVA
jgi:ribulose 1,5-bisphosphate synthetase/thiazole synthase